MKKLLGILVLGLMWCNTANALKLSKCYSIGFTATPYGKSIGFIDEPRLVDAKFPDKNYDDIYYEIFEDGIRYAEIYSEEGFERAKADAKHIAELMGAPEGFKDPDRITTFQYQITFADSRLIEAERHGFLLNRYSLIIDLKKNTVEVITETKGEIGLYKKISSNFKQCNSSGSTSTGSDIASSGSGFFINNKGYFVTNYHVIVECNQSKITFNEEDVDAKLIVKDQFLDLALLRANVKPKSFLYLSADLPEKIQTIYVAGYPFGKGLSDDLKITQGIISSLKGYGDNSNEIQIDAAINPGNSGGPIVNEDGELVAVAVSGLAKDQTEGINFGIKVSSVKNFLDVNKIKYSTTGLSLFSVNTKKLNNLLEASTIYTFCN